ncbi:MAG: SLBB domain-containing protein [Nitrospira sp.]|nr:SLBB domain-containing protein [bacterium]MBL7047954.1 SLBB domain-containing protein [Nitrospira sp.]
MNNKAFDIDCVIIGLNTASTLEHCLESVLKSSYSRGDIFIYYVDGGSSDQSIEIAKQFPQVTVIQTNLQYPTPGHGRNKGWLAGTSPFVQFLDSDTSIDQDWFERAIPEFKEDTGAVQGELKEKHPEASIYNWLGDLEWNALVGECESFGGNVLIRRQILKKTGGYDEVMVGGEDPELSRRVRMQNWKILQIDAPMAKHDLAMTKIKQYIKRGYRTGYSFAAVAMHHDCNKGGFWLYETGRICVRGGVSLLLTAAALSGAGIDIKFIILLLPALMLLFYPLLFSVTKIAREKQLGRQEARIYAAHCSIIVIPQFLGIIRYLAGRLTGRPLRNRRNNMKARLSSIALLLCLVALATISCSTVKPIPDQINTGGDTEVKKVFDTELQKVKRQFASSGAIDSISNNIPLTYLLGPGDVMQLDVWKRPDISSAALTVGPDGIITIARIGNLTVTNRTREDIAEEIQTRLSKLYENPEVSLAISVYNNNKAFVLGRVTEPGIVTFTGQGTLLEAIALAGGRAAIEDEAYPSKCAIIRGSDLIIWVDLKELLDNGNLGLNAKIQNNDVIYIPEVEAQLAYVMGEVSQPGAIRLKGNMTYMDALMMAGGPTKDARLDETYLIRFSGDQGTVNAINLKDMIEKGDLRSNYLLQDNDILYVVPSSIGEFNFALKNITPFLQVLSLSTGNLENFGVMQEFRDRAWGQKGFVGN